MKNPKQRLKYYLIFNFLFYPQIFNSASTAELKMPGVYIEEKPSLPISSEINLYSKSELGSGESLAVGEGLTDQDWGQTLKVLTDQIIISDGSYISWRSKPTGEKVSKLLMKKDGNLVLLDQWKNILWESGTSGFDGADFHLKIDTGQIFSNGLEIWSTKQGLIKKNISGFGAVHRDIGNSLMAGQAMFAGEMLTYAGAGVPVRLCLTRDGQLGMLSDSGDEVLWRVDQKGKKAVRLVLETSGNLQLLDINKQVIWESGTSNIEDARFYLNEEFAGIYASGNRLIWSTANGLDQANITGPGAPHKILGDRLKSGQSMFPGEMLVNQSAGITTSLKLTPDGKLGFYSVSSNTPVWSPDQKGRKAARLTMELNGNLVLFDASNKTIWQSGTWHQGAYVHIYLSELFLAEKSDKMIWNPGWRTDEFYSVGNSLSSQQELKKNWMIKRDGASFKMQPDGKLVLYGDELQWKPNKFGGERQVVTKNKRLIWSIDLSAKGAEKVVFEDGNLVAYNKNNTKLWETGTAGNPGAKLQVQGIGKFSGIRIITPKGKVLWEKGDAFKRIFKLVWEDIYMPEYNDPSTYIFGEISVSSFGVKETRGHDDLFWKRTAKAGSRVYIKEEESYNADNHAGYKGRYKGEFKNKFQEYVVVEDFNGKYNLGEKGVQININIFDWDRIGKNDLLGNKEKIYYFDEFLERKTIRIYLESEPEIFGEVFFELSTIR